MANTTNTTSGGGNLRYGPEEMRQIGRAAYAAGVPDDHLTSYDGYPREQDLIDAGVHPELAGDMAVMGWDEAAAE